MGTNKMTKDNYIKAHLLIMALSSTCLMTTVFIPVKGWSLSASRILFFGLLLLFFALTLFVTFRHFREFEALTLPSLIAGPLYFSVSVVSYGNHKQVFLVTAAAVVITILGLLALLRKNRDAEDKYGGLLFIALGAAILSAVIRFMPVDPDSTRSEQTDSPEGWSVADTLEWHASDLCVLNDMAHLSFAEKKNTADTIVRILENDLGCPELKLVYEKLPDDIYGEYNNGKKTIAINRSILEQESDGWALYRMLAYECYFCYAVSWVELYENVPQKYKCLKPFRDSERYHLHRRNSKGKALEVFWRHTQEKASQYESESVKRARDVVNDYLEHAMGKQGESQWIL